MKELASKVLSVAETIYQSVIKNQAPDEPPVILQSPLLTVLAQRSSVSKINSSVVNGVGGSFQMPSSESLLQTMQNASVVDLKVYLKYLFKIKLVVFFINCNKFFVAK